MAEQELNFIIRAINASDKAFAEVQNNISDIQKGVKNMQPAFKAMAVAGTVAFGAIATVVGLSVKEAIVAESSINRLTQILKTSRGATDAQIDSLIRQADALEKVGVASKESILIAQSQLATFDLQAETIERLTPAIIDYVIAEKGASATSDDFRQMTNGLAQALQGNFTSLTKTGFVLDDATKALIETGTETERSAALVKVLNSTYKDFNITARDTTEGALMAMRNEFGNLQEAIGVMFLPIIRELTKSLTPIIEKITEWVEKNPELTRNIIIVAGAISGLTAILGILGMVILPAIELIKALYVAFVFLKTGIAGATKAMLAFFATPMGAALAILGSLALAIYLVYRKIKEMADMFGGWGNAFRLIVLGMKIDFLEFAESLVFAINQIFGVWGDKLTGIRASLAETRMAFDKLAVEGFNKAQEGVVGLDEELDAATANMIANLSGIGKEVEDINKKITETNKKFKELMVQDEKDFQDQVVGIVYNAKVEYERLAEEKNRALMEGRRNEVADIEQKMGQQMGIIQEYHNLQLGLGQQITDYQLYMGKSELGRAVEDYAKKRKMREEEHQKELAEITERSMAVKTSGESELKMIEDLKNAHIEAEKAKTSATMLRLSASSGGVSSLSYKSTPAFNIKDAIITPQGQVIKTDPADWLFATKNPMALAGAGNNITINMAGGYYLSENAAEEIGNKIIDKLKKIIRV